MGKVKLDLEAKPTFKRKVGIPTPTGEEAEVEFVFKYRDRVEMAALMDAYHARAVEREQAASEADDSQASLAELAREAIQRDVEAVLEVVEGWSLPQEFNASNIEKLARLYPGSTLRIISDYRAAVLEGRRGN